LGLFGKKCAYCGKKLEGTMYVTRMGKDFCTEKHADAYEEYKKKAQDENSGCGGGPGC
jgi:ribosomal protein L24E